MADPWRVRRCYLYTGTPCGRNNSYWYALLTTLLWLQLAIHRYWLHWQRRRHDSDRLPCQRCAGQQAQQRPQHAQLRRQLRLRIAGHGAGAARSGRRCAPDQQRQQRQRGWWWRRRRRRDVQCGPVLQRLRRQVPDAERPVLLRVWHGAPRVMSPPPRSSDPPRDVMLSTSPAPHDAVGWIGFALSQS